MNLDGKPNKVPFVFVADVKDPAWEVALDILNPVNARTYIPHDQVLVRWAYVSATNHAPVPTCSSASIFVPHVFYLSRASGSGLRGRLLIAYDTSISEKLMHNVSKTSPEDAQSSYLSSESGEALM